MTLQYIDDLLRSGYPPQISGSGDVPEIPDQQRLSRTHKLREIVLVAAQNAFALGSRDIDLIAEKLGDKSREAPWRLPIGDSGLLDFFLNILPVAGQRQPLRIHALRLVGNACADTDENRARVVTCSHLRFIITLLAEDSLLAFVVPVLYNVCVDYEPAQLEACNAGLSAALVDIVSSPRLASCRSTLNIICKIMQLLITQEPEVKLARPTTPAVFLGLATSRTYPPDLEDFCELMSVALAYLTREPFQTSLLDSGYLELLIQAFSDSYSRSDVANADPEDAVQLKQVWDAFVQVLADISGLPSFERHHPVGSPVVQRLINWLSGPPSYAHLQTAACLCLGNLIRSDEASTAIAKDVFPPLLNILSRASPSISATNGQPSSPSAQLLHAVLSFLKNLAIASANKPLLGVLLDPPLPILSRLWSETDTQPQTQFAAVSLARLLVTRCPLNAGRLCAPLSSDPASPARDRSNLYPLMALQASTDAEPTRFEAGRAVAAVVRALHTAPDQVLPPSAGDGVSGRRARFYAAHDAIARSLFPLLVQNRFPALRSEVWFALALASRTPEGARVVAQTLEPIDTCRVLVEAATGRDMLDGHKLLSEGQGEGEGEGAGRVAERTEQAGETDPIDGLGLEPQQADPALAAGAARVDKENCLVLVAELLKFYGDRLPEVRRNVFEDVLAKGGRQVAEEREEGRRIVGLGSVMGEWR